MNNPLARSIKSKAEKRLYGGLRFWKNDEQMLKSYVTDHADLMWVAILIENGFSDNTICQSIRKLDTIVREVVPQKVFDRYFPEKS